jgi:hypothetical protein
MLDWGDPLPPSELKASERICRRALCLLCLGTSLYINPCGLLPTRTKKAGGHVAIVSLSETAQDEVADMVSRCEADAFMTLLCGQLRVAVPAFVPTLTFYVAQACVRASASDDAVRWRVVVSACSDGQPSPLPHLARAAVRARGSGGDADACVSSGKLDRWTFEGTGVAAGSAPLRLSLQLAWHSVLSRSAGDDVSVIELELSPAPDSLSTGAPSTARNSGHALQQSQGWHRIGRCACARALRIALPSRCHLLPDACLCATNRC